jgi:hypothetical protein
VGTNDAGTTYTDYYFHSGGSITDSKGNTYAKISDITKSQVGLENVQNTAFYKRVTTVNDTPWNMAGTTNSAAFTIYAPITAGTSGQVLTSTAGTPSWTNQSSLSVGSAAIANRLALNGIADSTTYGTYAGIIQTNTGGPESESWHNSLKILHNNSSGYYTQLAQNFTGSHGLWHRSNRAGTISRWYKVIDD